jgi:hypothetical protein
MNRYIAGGVIAVFTAVQLCAQQPVQKLEPQTQTHPFFPLNIGDKWTYRYVELKAAKKAEVPRTVEIEVEREELYQAKNEKGVVVGLHGGFILKSTSGNKTQHDHVVILKDGVHRVSTAGTAINPPLNFFYLPRPPKDDKWEINSVSGNKVVKGTCTWRTESVAVPRGKFDTVAVLFTNNEKDEFKRVEVEYWFAKDIGMVKQRILQQGHEHALELEKYTPKK